jgi:hypothetical protein
MLTHSPRTPAADRLAAGSEDKPSHLRDQSQNRSFLTWTPRDVSICHALGFALQLSGRSQLAELLRETVVELAGNVRPPRIADAWRFFDARRALLKYDDTAAPAYAHQFGVRIAEAVTGLHVIDVSLIEAGSSAAFAVTHDGPAGAGGERCAICSDGAHTSEQHLADRVSITEQGRALLRGDAGALLLDGLHAMTTRPEVSP